MKLFGWRKVRGTRWIFQIFCHVFLGKHFSVNGEWCHWVHKEMNSHKLHEVLWVICGCLRYPWDPWCLLQSLSLLETIINCLRWFRFMSYPLLVLSAWTLPLKLIKLLCILFAEYRGSREWDGDQFVSQALWRTSSGNFSIAKPGYSKFIIELLWLNSFFYASPHVNWSSC